jgi:hypothetical protein
MASAFVFASEELSGLVWRVCCVAAPQEKIQGGFMRNDRFIM